MSKFIFLNCIANGALDWKQPLTAEGQPGIADCFMIFEGDDDGPQITAELSGPSAANLNQYAEAIASGVIVVAHSAQYHVGHLRAVMIAMGIDPCDGRTMTLDTMFALTGHAEKFNGRKGWPTFSEACAWAGVDRAATESAEDNARCLRLVFAQMQRQGIVPEPKIWRERNST
jgi:hypothetical protein